MADEIIIKIVLDTRDIQRAAQEIQSKLQSAFDSGSASARRLKTEIEATSAGINSTRRAVDGLTSALATLGGLAVFKQITQFGIDLDRSRNTMIALTGSIGAANEKLAELRKLAASSPGVTTSFATDLFKQLKAIGNIT